ncbi:hypothetical protein IVB36_21560 [Bradyrhizobium sp. 35]|uniref:hypothetical protein n=1 Tax=Bradyrhizobium sp. 35 TaxID=2782670 RepID=UPI001FFAFCA4|nr:hypothetical protein [Bradyrhizobium sp. 35]MCK1453394.1 hypothetical protein [Bradyrhizobium sp. 35]
MGVLSSTPNCIIKSSPRFVDALCDVLMVLSVVLRIKRRLDGVEIDKIIWDVASTLQ